MQVFFWWAMTGSNRRHPACKAGALPAELIALFNSGNVLLSQGVTPSTISAEELDFRVRDGNGYILFAIATGNLRC